MPNKESSNDLRSSMNKPLAEKFLQAINSKDDLVIGTSKP